MYNNLDIRQFTLSITDFVNKSQLPVEVKRLALKEVLAQVEADADALIKQEIMDRNRQEEEVTKDATE